MGHLIPFVEFAKLFVLHHDFHITCIIPVFGSPPKAMKEVLEALPTSIDHVFLPPVSSDGLESLHPEVQIAVTMTRSLPSLPEVLKSTRVTALVVDVFGMDALHVAKELNIPPYIYFLANAFSLSLLSRLPKIDETVSCENTLRKIPGATTGDLPEPLKLPGCIPIHSRDLPDPIQDRTAEGIILNTFMELEESAVKALLEEEAKNLSLYPIGPITRTGSNSSNQVEGSVCLRWLDNQQHGSVLFVCFGSGGTLSYEQIVEFRNSLKFPTQINELALGLELSGYKFIWVLRSPNNKSSITYLSDQTHDNNPLAFLPKGFVERTKGQGLVVPFWALQVQVLSHSSTGGFLTHCSWNSILESITHGIPLITWPLFAKQRLNAVLLDEDLKVALRPKANEKGLMDREEIAKVIKGLMVRVEGKKVKSHMKGLKIAAERALSADGSSTEALAEFASYCTNQPSF
ncbi:hypothetical protein ACB092_11G150100 [Castanea dentata]